MDNGFGRAVNLPTSTIIWTQDNDRPDQLLYQVIADAIMELCGDENVVFDVFDALPWVEHLMMVDKDPPREHTDSSPDPPPKPTGYL